MKNLAVRGSLRLAHIDEDNNEIGKSWKFPKQPASFYSDIEDYASQVISAFVVMIAGFFEQQEGLDHITMANILYRVTKSIHKFAVEQENAYKKEIGK